MSDMMESVELREVRAWMTPWGPRETARRAANEISCCAVHKAIQALDIIHSSEANELAEAIANRMTKDPEKWIAMLSLASARSKRAAEIDAAREGGQS
jgi:hypothetical protein